MKRVESIAHSRSRRQHYLGAVVTAEHVEARVKVDAKIALHLVQKEEEVAHAVRQPPLPMPEPISHGLTHEVVHACQLRVPPNKDSSWNIRTFGGTETYEEIGQGFL